MRLGLVPQPEGVEDLVELFRPGIALDKKTGMADRGEKELMILGQEGAFFAPGQKKEVAILGLVHVDGVEPEDPEPLAQLPQHTINDKFHRRNPGGLPPS